MYTAIGLAAGACSGNGILLDIKDPVHPKRVDAVNDPNYSYWHSASFSNDGSKVVFTDEWGGGLGARCRPNDPNHWGADAIFHLHDDKLTFASYYKLPAAQSDTENCVAHNGSLVPVPGRDIEVQAWYQGGISLMDFTDATHPYEIAYFDRGPDQFEMLVLGGDWSGLLVQRLHLRLRNRARARRVRTNPDEVPDPKRNRRGEGGSVARSERAGSAEARVACEVGRGEGVRGWLERSQALPADRITTGSAHGHRHLEGLTHMSKSKVAKLKGMSPSLEKDAANAKSPADATRLHGLADILKHPSA